MEVPPCPLCGEGEARPILEAEDDWIPDGSSRGFRFSVVRCNRCRACFTSPRFPETAKQMAFEGSYPFYDRARRAVGPPSEAEMQAFDRRVGAILKSHPTPGSVLDVGMGDGAFLAAMQRRGWDVTGIDVESSVVNYARSYIGIQCCSVADVEKDPLPEGLFDAITLWGMLQLAYHPQTLLEKLRLSLAPGGILAIGVSNFSSAGSKVFRSKWRGLGLPRHLVHYDPVSLVGLVERAGYRVLGLTFETPGWIVSGSMNAALPLPGFLGRVARFTARNALGCMGHSRWGDTITVLAEVAIR